MNFPADFYTALHRGHPGDIDYYRALVTGQDRVLELGCGCGRVSAELGTVATSVLGVESHPGMLERAKDRTQTLPNVEIIEGDMRTMGDWGVFDRILVPFTGLFCLDRPGLVQCLRNIHERLKPKGVLSFDVYPPEIYHESDIEKVPYEWRTNIHVDDYEWAVDEEIVVCRNTQEISVSYRHHRLEGEHQVQGPTYTIRHHYVCGHEWSSLLYDAGFEDWFFWGNFEGGDPDEESDILVCWATRGD